MAVTNNPHHHTPEARAHLMGKLAQNEARALQDPATFLRARGEAVPEAPAAQIDRVREIFAEGRKHYGIR